MKKYTIIETRPALCTWTFEVEAETEEEALRMVEDGEVDPDDYDVDNTFYDSQFIVEDVVEINKNK
jgi:hypothetical protein